MNQSSRRDFLKKTALTAGLIPLVGLNSRLWAKEDYSASNKPLSISIFSKQLQFLDAHSLGQIAAEMGFAGVDLTVRPGGHVEPENVKNDLPKFIDALKKGGSDCVMMSTAIESVNNSLDVDVLEAASNSGIKFYRMNWLKFQDDTPLEKTLEKYKIDIHDLSLLNKKLGLVGCYQNHAGTFVGASLWEVKKILESADPVYFGSQYDVRHAIVEGANSWINGFRLIEPQIKTIVLKDFKWGQDNGVWKLINVPIGEGMVDFNYYFKLLKKYNLNVPVSLHVEHSMGGAEKGQRTISISKEEVYNTIKKDLVAIQKLWKEA